MANAYERWSGEQESREGENTATSVREFDVTDAANAAAVYGAALILTTYANTGNVPIHNESHPTDSRKKVSSRRVTRVGLALWRLAVYYSIPLNGSSHPGDEDNPLLQPTRFSWGHTKNVVTVDRDADGNPIGNSNLIAFANGAQRDVTDRILSAVRYETAYNPSIADAFIDAVNSSTLNIAGIGSFPAGTVKCNVYEPVGEFVVGYDYIEIRYELQIRKDGWRTRQLDEGTMGRTGAGLFLPLVAPSGKEISVPVRLNGGGNAMDFASYKIANPSGNILEASDPNPPPGAEIEADANATFLRYRVYPEIDLNSLGL